MVLARKEFLPFEKRMQVDVDNTVVLRIKKVYLKEIRISCVSLHIILCHPITRTIGK